MVITGYYQELICLTTLIVFHEFGHFYVAKIMGFKVKEIVIYPYGGLTKIEDNINQDINKEILVDIAGILAQLIFFFIIYNLYKINIIREYAYSLYKIYNKNLIMFNILPIIPLDGFKLLNHLFEKIFPYITSKKIMIVISIITIIIMSISNMYKKNYSYILIVSILINYLIKLIKNIKYLYNRFLLERYMYKYKYKRVKIINNYKKMYKNYNHLIKRENKLIKEEIFLSNLFDLDDKIW